MVKLSEFVSAIYNRLDAKKMKHALKIQSEIRRVSAEFLRDNGFLEISPVIISPITDPLHHATGKAELEYYGNVYQLTRSMIMHKQISLLSCDKIFTFSPNVRLEPIELIETGKHLVEFTQLDLEVKNATREDVIDLGERLLIHVLTEIKESCDEQLKFFDRTLNVPSRPFERITYDNAYSRFGSIFETVLSYEHVEPFWIVDIPIDAREFYDKEDSSRPGILLDMDLIYPEGYGEALSGGEREHTYDRILHRLEKSGLDPANFEWYLEFAKRGLPPSAGFGIGIERLTRFVTGLKNIYDVTLFPKLPGQLSL